MLPEDAVDAFVRSHGGGHTAQRNE
jgi:hypothetical protein